MNVERLFVCDAYDAGFNIEPVNINRLDDTRNSFNDLKLSRGETDYSLIDKTTLFSLNGLIYPSVVDGNSIVLKNAYNYLDEGITLIRTNQLGEITKTPFIEDQITNPNVIDSTSQQAIYINVDFNLFEKFYFLVIGGFIFIDAPGIDVVGPNRLRIKQLSLNLDEKFLYARKYFPMYDIIASIPNDTSIYKKEFYKFEMIKKMFLLENSFIVSFDKKLICRKITLGSHALPGKYETETVMDNLLLSHENKILNYRIGGNEQFPIVEGSNYMAGLSRSRTTQNDSWSVVDNDPPFKKVYEGIDRIYLELIA